MQVLFELSLRKKPSDSYNLIYKFINCINSVLFICYYTEKENEESVYFQIDIKVIEVITQFCNWKLFPIDFLTFPHIYIYID